MLDELEITDDLEKLIGFTLSLDRQREQYLREWWDFMVVSPKHKFEELPYTHSCLWTVLAGKVVEKLTDRILTLEHKVRALEAHSYDY